MRMISLIDYFSIVCADAEILALAIWYHDSIYDIGLPENMCEELSADYARHELTAAGVDAQVVSSVAQLILAPTPKRTPELTPLMEMFMDMDLEILAASEHVYEQYMLGIRMEYVKTPYDDYRKGRSDFLKQLLSRSRIYNRLRCEPIARRNIEKELVRLSSPVDIMPNVIGRKDFSLWSAQEAYTRLSKPASAPVVSGDAT